MPILLQDGEPILLQDGNELWLQNDFLSAELLPAVCSEIALPLYQSTPLTAATCQETGQTLSASIDAVLLTAVVREFAETLAGSINIDLTMATCQETAGALIGSVDAELLVAVVREFALAIITPITKLVFHEGGPWRTPYSGGQGRTIYFGGQVWDGS